MPRQPRYFIEGLPQHVIQRGVDRQPVFFGAKDYAHYKSTLCEAAKDCGCGIHAYVLMTNHVHLLLTPQASRSLPRLIQAMGRGYVQTLNKRHRRTGTLWEGRYKATLVQSDRYALTCYQYIELNPVRAGIVPAPEAYEHSSYRHNGLGENDLLITSHPIYDSLGTSAAERQRRYRELFPRELENTTIDRIRKTTNACLVLGDNRFKEQIEAMLGRSVRPGRSGRPRRGNPRRSAD